MAFQVLKVFNWCIVKTFFFKCLQVSNLDVHAVHYPFDSIRKPQLLHKRVELYFKEPVTINMTRSMISSLVIRRNKIIV